MTDQTGNSQQTEKEENLPQVSQSNELLLVELPEEHQRFYDKLRAKIEKFIREQGMSHNMAQYILLAPDLFVLLARLMIDKRIPVQTKAIAGIAVAYFISPVDFIPEMFTGAFGLIDDVVLAVFSLRRILVDVNKEIVLEHWNGKRDLLEVITDVIKKADDFIGKKVLRKIEDTVMGKGKRK